MVRYALYDLTLEVRQAWQEPGAVLVQLLHDLSWVRAEAPVSEPSLRLCLHLNDNGVSIPSTARAVFQAGGFQGFEAGDNFFLSDGSSLLQLQTQRGQGAAYLAPSFMHKPVLLQRHFWAFGLLKLLQPLGIFALHAAGVVATNGLGVLIVGASGSGKSTLALGLIRQGWRYLSDDAVLLRPHPVGVEALALRQHFYLNADAAGTYPDLPIGDDVPDASGGFKCKVDIRTAYPGQQASTCIPGRLLFSHISPSRHSTLHPLDPASVLQQLLANSGPQLFDRHTMPQHLAVLKQLTRQAVAYELQAGRDLHQDPRTLVQLLANVEGEERWPASSSS